MNKFLLSLLVALMPLFCAAQATAKSSSTPSIDKKVADGAYFTYRPSSILLYQDVDANDASLQWLYGAMKANRMAVLSGKAHFEIFSFIPASKVGDPTAINDASLQASVVRAYLKTQYGIAHESCTFAIDTTQGKQNVVQLQLVSGAVPQYANSQIAYSINRTPAAVKSAVAEYTSGVPYMSYLMYMARRNVNFGSGGDFYALRDGSWEKEEFNEFAKNAKLSELAAVSGIKLYVKTTSGTYIPATVADIDNGVNILYARSADGTYNFASATDILAVAKATNASFPASAYLSTLSSGFVPAKTEVQTRIEERVVIKEGYRERPIFGFKTNLLSWAAIVPNIGLEFYIGKLVSIEVSGQYTWLSDLLGKEKAYYMWGVGAELRFWLKGNGKFDGLFLGLYGNAGQYDFKLGHTGNQGDYYSAGLSIGYVLPVGKHLNIEFGLAGGYLNYINQAYVWDGRKNIPVDPINPIKSDWKIFPTKASVSLLWKF